MIELDGRGAKGIGDLVYLGGRTDVICVSGAILFYFYNPTGF